MISKVTVTAPANIAFVKYWGRRDPARAIPANPSVSMTLSRCRTVTTVTFVPGDEAPDRIAVVDADGIAMEATGGFRERALAQIDRLRAMAGSRGTMRVATRNTFPTGAGIASSASGFAALTVAGARALGLDLDASGLSRLARESGSGSAARSLFGGYVEWPAPGMGPEAGAAPIAAPDWWDLRDVIAVVDRSEKDIPSVEGHRRAASSPHWSARQSLLPARTARVRDAIGARDIDALGPLLEEEAVELHIIAMSSIPPIFYWKPGTLRVLDEVRGLRGRGRRAWATMDAGANVHVICEAEDEDAVAEALRSLPEVEAVIVDGVGDGPRFVEEHLS